MPPRQRDGAIVARCRSVRFLTLAEQTVWMTTETGDRQIGVRDPYRGRARPVLDLAPQCGCGSRAREQCMVRALPACRRKPLRCVRLSLQAGRLMRSIQRIRADGSERWLILAVLFLARTAMGFQFQAVAALSSFVVADLEIDYARLGLLIGLYLLPGVAIAY